MDNKVKNILKYIFWTAVAAVLVWFCVKSIDWKEFLLALGMCKWEYVAGAFIVGCIFIVIRGVRWHMLIQPLAPSISRKDVINAYGIGFIANMVLPRLGEVVKIGYVVKNAGTDADGKKRLTWDAAIGTYLAEKGIDALVLVTLSVIFLVGTWNRMKETMDFGVAVKIAWAAGGLAVSAIAVIILSYLLRSRGGFFLKVWEFLAGIGRGIMSVGKLEKLWLFMLYTASIWVSFWLTSAMIVWALQDIEPFTALTGASAFDLTVSGCLSTLIPVPGGFGAFHGAVATVMQAIYGIPMGSGMIYATLNHETQLLAQAVTGLWCYVSQTFFRK